MRIEAEVNRIAADSRAFLLTGAPSLFESQQATDGLRAGIAGLRGGLPDARAEQLGRASKELKGEYPVRSVVASGRVDLAPLVTHRFELDDIAQAYELFAHRREGVLKVAITP